MAKIQVKLSKAEERMLKRLPESDRAGVKAEILADKEAQIERDIQNREEFRIVPNGVKGTVSVYGNGNRFPATFYPDQWQLYADNMEAILAVCAEVSGTSKRKAK